MTQQHVGTTGPSWLRRVIWRLRTRVEDVYAVKCYSQEGEDLILGRLFGGQARGFYVDVGAHDPRRFSNTYGFYRMGWSGINIEPNPEALREFSRLRPRDVNLQIGVAEEPGELTYHCFDEPALNTFDAALVRHRVATTSYRVLSTMPVPVERLDAILNRHLPAGQDIDFMSIDVEGLDLAVVRSNDWARFRPHYLLAEALESSLDGVLGSEMTRFMRAQGYGVFAKLYNTVVFERLSQPLAGAATEGRAQP